MSLIEVTHQNSRAGHSNVSIDVTVVFDSAVVLV